MVEYQDFGLGKPRKYKYHREEIKTPDAYSELSKKVIKAVHDLFGLNDYVNLHTGDRTFSGEGYVLSFTVKLAGAPTDKHISFWQNRVRFGSVNHLNLNGMTAMVVEDVVYLLEPLGALPSASRMNGNGTHHTRLSTNAYGYYLRVVYPDGDYDGKQYVYTGADHPSFEKIIEQFNKEEKNNGK